MSTTTTTRGSSFTKRIVAVAAVGAAAAVVAVALHAHLPAPATASAAVAKGSSISDVQLASWTGTPRALTASSATGSAASAWCENGLAADSSAPATVSNLDQRGSIASMLVSRGGYTSFCLSDGEKKGMWEIVNEPGTKLAPVDSSAIDLGSEDEHGTPSVNSAWGSAGTDVKSVVLHADGRTVSATVDHGFWTAWWPGATAPSAMKADVTTTAGTHTTVTLGE